MCGEMPEHRRAPVTLLTGCGGAQLWRLRGHTCLPGRAPHAPRTRAGICLDQPLDVAVRGCRHRLCIDCALRLCELSKKPPLCPFCRAHIEGFAACAAHGAPR